MLFQVVCQCTGKLLYQLWSFMEWTCLCFSCPLFLSSVLLSTLFPPPYSYFPFLSCPLMPFPFLSCPHLTFFPPSWLNSHRWLTDLLLFPHSPKSLSQAGGFGSTHNSLSQQWGHDPSVNFFVDGDVLYWCGFQRVSSQRAINSPELTLKSTQTTAVGKHSALWRCFRQIRH